MRGYMYNYYTCSVVREVAMYADIMSKHLVSDEAELMNFIRMNNATFGIPLVLGNTRHETAFGDSIAGETIAATLRRLNCIAITTREFQKQSFISSAFRLPKMHRATRD